MNKNILTLLLLFLGGPGILSAQAPQKFNYQGIARSSSGAPLVNKTITLRLSLLDGSATGLLQYMETQTATTNAYGLFNVAMGAGTVSVGSIGAVTWSSGNKYLEVEMDPNGGTAWVPLGTTQLLSVPYAMYAMTPAGAQGPAGPQGNTGPQGPPGAGSLNGTTNKVIKFTGTSVGGDSQIYDNGDFIGIGATSGIGAEKLRINYAPYNGWAGMNISSTDVTGKPFISFGNNNSLLAYMYVDGTDANKLKFSNSGDKLTLTTDGKVGIGTTAPNQLLNLYSGANNSYLNFNNDFSGATNSDGLLVGLDNQGGGWLFNCENQPLHIGTNYSSRMTITADGRINIGSEFANAGQLYVENNGTGLASPSVHFKNNHASGIGLFVETNSTDATSVIVNSRGATVGMNSVFAKYFDGGASDLIRLDDNDGLGAGRIKLFGNASGTGNGGFILGSHNFGLIMGTTNSLGNQTYIANAYVDGSGNQKLVAWTDATVSLGSSSYRWTSVWSTNGVIQTSDERDKQNIQSLKYGINTVMGLHPVSFEWKNGKSRLGTGTNLGFIAQELEKVIPDAVIHTIASAEEIENAAKAGRGTLEADTYGVKYSEIIPVLVKAIQDQQVQIEELKKEVQELKNK